MQTNRDWSRNISYVCVKVKSPFASEIASSVCCFCVCVVA